MAIKLTDERIAELINEKKLLPSGYREGLIGAKMKIEDVHKRGKLKITGEEGDVFYVDTRISKLNPFDFSVILVYEFKETTATFNLRRYNGKTSIHTNRIEGDEIQGFHIHYATERYQDQEFKEEAYAESTDRYTDLGGALNCLIEDCNFVLPPDEPMPLL